MRKDLKTRKVTVRFTQKEYTKLEAKFRKTTSPQLSHYVRNVILEKPVTVKYRNESLDVLMEELIILKQELNAIGNNFNQAVKKLHILKMIPEFRNWIVGNEMINQQIKIQTEKIEQQVDQLSDKWLQVKNDNN